MLNVYSKVDDRVTLRWSTCDGMCSHILTVNSDWFNSHNKDCKTYEELQRLAYKDKECSMPEGKSSWWGLG